MRRRDVLFLSLAAAVIAFDQLTKHLVRAYIDPGETFPDGWAVRLVNVSNTGAAFGILQNQGAFLVITSLVGVVAILLYYAYPPFEYWPMTAALALVLGGAVGNLSDRIRLGEVTDFIDFPRYPSFNVADSSIVVGVAVLAGLLALGLPHRAPPKGEP
ncbi:MAG: signal peptidase II [Chloroflexi bacterium RBG_13_60_13]|nr:MAG: signal peptidase II [Chloroflexi bacterium RBG_13_60_13]